MIHKLSPVSVSPCIYVYIGIFKCNVTLNSVRQHDHFITQGNYKVTCFDCRLVILRPILSIMSQDAMHTLGSHRVYIHGIHQIESFVSKGVTCKLCLHFTRQMIQFYVSHSCKHNLHVTPFETNDLI